MIERAVQDGLPGEIVLADSAYGESTLFRETGRLHGLDYAVGVHAPTKVWCVDKSEQRRGVVPGDHGDIIGHCDDGMPDGIDGHTRYDLLCSGADFGRERFEMVWRSVRDFALACEPHMR